MYEKIESETESTVTVFLPTPWLRPMAGGETDREYKEGWSRVFATPVQVRALQEQLAMALAGLERREERKFRRPDFKKVQHGYDREQIETLADEIGATVMTPNEIVERYGINEETPTPEWLASRLNDIIADDRAFILDGSADWLYVVKPGELPAASEIVKFTDA